MEWGVIAYDTRLPLILIHGTMIVKGYVHDIFQLHVLPLMTGLSGALFQQQNAWPYIVRMSQNCLRQITTLPWPARSPDLSPNEHIFHLGRQIGQPTSLVELEALLQHL
ncbi:transposable element Tcb2 transposase [Trichonephila clavipes]|nr:transposable element Tcb2 transposase [Trichonephila clavipes]